MKVYQDLEGWMSQGIKRVGHAVRRYAPSDIEFVDTAEMADLVVLHTVGDGQRSRWLNPDRPYAVIQYCLRTTELPDTKDWLPFWRTAKAVWSYYDLFEKCFEDESYPRGDYQKPFNFYHAALGGDGNVFRPSMPMRKTFLFGTSGYIADTESVGECYRVCRKRDRDMFHLGPNLNLGDGVTYVTGIPDDTLAEMYSRCSYISGLRRVEGFELPAVEGLLCGARPVLFDVPHYRQWFGEFAEYVPEVEPAALVDHLLSLVSSPIRAVTQAERSQAVQQFNWETLVKGFWEAVR
jgi:hypothetical protein